MITVRKGREKWKTAVISLDAMEFVRVAGIRQIDTRFKYQEDQCGKMIKRKIVETTEEYDANGKLTRKSTTETIEDDDSIARGFSTMDFSPWWSIVPRTNLDQSPITYRTDLGSSEKSN